MSLECPQDVLNLAKKGSVEHQCSVTDIEEKKEIRATCLFLGELGDPVIFFALFSFNTSLKV